MGLNDQKERLKALAQAVIVEAKRARLIFEDTPDALLVTDVTFFFEGLFRKLRRCPECQKIFLRRRKDKGFCSKPCQVRVAVRRLRNTPPDRIGKRGRPPKSLKTSPPPPNS